jgi:aryl-alcohol dehydrogenase-like predicted oxidoreductase
MDSTAVFEKGDLRNFVPRLTPHARKANQAIVACLEPLLAETNATPAQIAIAWLLAQKRWIVPIPGTTKLVHLKENVDAARIELSERQLAELKLALTRIQVEGDRYPARTTANG